MSRALTSPKLRTGIPWAGILACSLPCVAAGLLPSPCMAPRGERTPVPKMGTGIPNVLVAGWYWHRVPSLHVHTQRSAVQPVLVVVRDPRRGKCLG